MVDREGLISELTPYGNIVFCDENNIISYIVVVSDVITDVTTLKNITDNYLLGDYPNLNTISLVDNTFKCQYNKS